MLHLLYMLVFTVLAVLAVGNLIRNMFVLGRDSQRGMPAQGLDPQSPEPPRPQRTPHPELFNNAGELLNEPLLVMRSLPIDEVRSKLDALYNSSPSEKTTDSSEEA